MVDIRKFRREILFYRDNKRKLLEIRSELQVEKMLLDKSFSVFLAEQHHYDMSAEETDTELWTQYKDMRKNYTDVDELIKLATFYIER